jgi:hypothetical protein
MYQQLGILLLQNVFLCNAWDGIIMTTLTGTFLIQPNQVAHVTSVNYGLPNYVMGATVTLPDGNVYFLGGSSSGLSVPTTTVTRINSSTNTSTTATSMNNVRRLHAATIVNNTIIVCGGNNAVGNAGTTSCEQSSVGVTSWTNITSLPTLTFKHTMVTLNGNAYVMGGQDYPALVYMYNGTTWITKAPLSPGRYAHQALALDADRALICGGYTPSAPNNTCIIYTASTDQYSSAPAMANTRAYFGFVMSESMVECVVDRT